jgi:hypothetical protein
LTGDWSCGDEGVGDATDFPLIHHVRRRHRVVAEQQAWLSPAGDTSMNAPYAHTH